MKDIKHTKTTFTDYVKYEHVLALCYVMYSYAFDKFDEYTLCETNVKL